MTPSLLSDSGSVQLAIYQAKRDSTSSKSCQVYTGLRLRQVETENGKTSRERMHACEQMRKRIIMYEVLFLAYRISLLLASLAHRQSPAHYPARRAHRAAGPYARVLDSGIHSHFAAHLHVIETRLDHVARRSTRAP